MILCFIFWNHFILSFRPTEHTPFKWIYSVY